MSKNKKNEDIDYLYASALFKSLEVKNITRDKFEKMIEAKSIGDAVLTLAECGYGDGNINNINNIDNIDNGGTDYEYLFVSEQKKIYDLVFDIIPEKSIVNFFKYQNDCHNIKSILKSEFAEKSENIDGLLLDTGIVEAETAKRVVRDRTFEKYPVNMAEAAKAAIENYSRNKDPMTIDIILDKACFADMLEAAKESKCPFLVVLARKKADLANIMLTIRIIRMKNTLELLRRALISGGNLEEGFFINLFDAQESKLFDALKYTEYSRISETVSYYVQTIPLSELEKICDEVYCSHINEAKFIPYGAEVAVGYIAAKEIEIKNARIVLAGKEAGIDGDIIRERLRAVYA